VFFLVCVAYFLFCKYWRLDVGIYYYSTNCSSEQFFCSSDLYVFFHIFSSIYFCIHYFFVVDNLMAIFCRIMTVFLHVISLLDIEKANDDLCDYGLDCDKDNVANKIVYDALSSSLVKIQIFLSFAI